MNGTERSAGILKSIVFDHAKYTIGCAEITTLGDGGVEQSHYVGFDQIVHVGGNRFELVEDQERMYQPTSHLVRASEELIVLPTHFPI